MRKNGTYHLKRLLPALALGTMILAAGCSNDSSTQPPSEFAPPSNLTFQNLELEGQIVLDWNGSSDEGRNDFAGYNVYRSSSSLAGATNEQLMAALITTNPVNARTYTDGTPVVGTKYFYSVRSVKDNGDLSEPANEIDTALPMGGSIITSLAEFSAPGASGMDLSEGQTYSVVIENLEHIDFFLGTTDDGNGPTFPLAMKSPSLLGGPNAAQWATRVAGFKLVDDPNISSTSASGFIDSITMVPAETVDKAIVVRLPLSNGETHYGKLEIQEFTGTAPNRAVRFTWTYQPVPDYLRF
ncbi:MAG: hypothetical protein KC729_13100 [Candidatus Eisenbacteria bacterium]|uniref:Fibronectin type-III domain-containing protein n=1 Tax=Eiseniibacteriota bacterium TaxID=2212470 RepID=A0A956LZY6_UNCEI|nr:hypothetical protein [Candidatus Eisenbacteria bacterium]